MLGCLLSIECVGRAFWTTEVQHARQATHELHERRHNAGRVRLPQRGLRRLQSVRSRQSERVRVDWQGQTNPPAVLPQLRASLQRTPRHAVAVRQAAREDDRPDRQVLVHGCSIEATADICEVTSRTVESLLEKAGRRAEDFHRLQLEKITQPLEVVELDELHGRSVPTKKGELQKLALLPRELASVAARAARGFMRLW